MSYINFTIITAITDLLKIEAKMKRDICDLLSNEFTALEVDREIHNAVSLGLIKQTGLIKTHNHEQTTYKLERYPI